ncbi:MAG TPA: hypothetical protein GXZ51_02700 [Acholeplasma sp.]|jgi:uncharacterized BrkB/YihY/UPF0761 family membrane protein|nr:hypothetical protein [Acholeplasma sp.]
MKEKQTVEKKQKYSKNSIFFIAMTTLMGLSEMFLIALIINNSIILKNYDNYSVHEDFDKVPKEFFIFSIVIAVILMALFGFTIYLTIKMLLKRKQEGTL